MWTGRIAGVLVSGAEVLAMETDPGIAVNTSFKAR
jgi:hypothetical protein